jgi:putative membrane protein
LIIIAVIPVAFVVVVVMLARRPQTPVAWPQPGDRALAELRERFARAEIDAAEFEERKRTLGG